MIKLIAIINIFLFLTANNRPSNESTLGNLGIPAQVTISKTKLMDKSKEVGQVKLSEFHMEVQPNSNSTVP